jgi:hypothetical protein
MKCLKMCKKKYLSNHPDIALIYNALGNLFFELEDNNKAKKFYTKCFRISDKILPSNHKNLATICHCMGNYNFFRERY